MNFYQNKTSRSNIDLDLYSGLTEDLYTQRPFNPNRIWKRNRLNICPHIYTIENGHYIPLPEAGQNKTNHSETKKKSNIFMDRYRKILPKEYKKGQIPLSKRHFLVDKDKSLSVGNLMHPKLGGINDNLFHMSDKMHTNDQEEEQQESVKVDTSDVPLQKKKFDKGYSVDSVYSLDKGFGYPKVGHKKFQMHKGGLNLKNNMKQNVYLNRSNKPKIRNETADEYLENSMEMPNNITGKALTCRPDVFNRNKFDYEIVGRGITEFNYPGSVSHHNKSNCDWKSSSQFMQSFNLTNRDMMQVNKSNSRMFLKKNKDFIDLEQEIPKNFMPKIEDQGYKTSREFPNRAMNSDNLKIAMQNHTNKHTNNDNLAFKTENDHLNNLKKAVSYTNGFSEADNRFDNIENNLTQNFGEVIEKGTSKKKFFSPKQQTKVLDGNPSFSNLRTNTKNKSSFLKKK